jgi:DNA-binding NarL/FixJ family response regulator
MGRPATLSELAREVEMPEDKVTEALRFAAEPLSLSEPLREDGDAELGDVVEDRSAESPFEVAATALLPDEIARLLAPLDEREREILKLIARGDSNKLIARALDIAETTVKIHVQHILRKLGLSSRVQAAVYAVNNGLDTA